ncbi:Aspartic peptidase [Gossypium australe]|uniref:Aspartic peptidase n=1 Tax=Gossypium australe TaxID=47621 RepID=A0A5B6X043_9ROSI|nr:Aspartic peptidase [Gossypium australe]
MEKQPQQVEGRQPPSFPQRFQKLKQDFQFKKILGRPEATSYQHTTGESIGTNAQLCKDILSKKHIIREFEIVALTEGCTTKLMRKLPPKLKDPGSFTILCSIGNHYVRKALCDLGASINLMPMFVFKKLGMGKARPTTVTLQLAGRSYAHPEGKIEYVLVSVEKFIFLANFIILECEVDKEVPTIFGRHFLATEDPPSLELKPLSLHLKYTYLGYNNMLLAQLLDILKRSRKALGWIIVNIKGINSTICMHKILLEDWHDNSIE